MIWSVIPEELIFSQPAQRGQPPAALLIRYLNRQVMVRQGRVETLLSTNPADFLDERFLPGALVGRV